MGKQQISTEHTVVLRFGGGEVRAKVRDGVVLLPKELMQGRVKVNRRPKPRPKAVSAVNLARLTGTADYGPSAVARRLVSALGNNAVAALLGVNQDRPSRWSSGRDVPNEENRQHLADLDSLVGHLLTAFTPPQARLWLEGPNAALNARPIDVYRIDGAAPVLEAIRAHEQGAYA